VRETTSGDSCAPPLGSLVSKKTILHDCHVRLGGRIVDFHGWMLPVQYAGVLAEHRHCRSHAAVFDTSHMGQVLISGPDAAAQIARTATQDAAAMRPGLCRYGFLLNAEGGVLDDTILMRLGDEEFLLVVNAGTREADLAWLGEHLSGDLTVRNLSGEGWGKIDLQGPAAAAVLQPLAEPDVTDLAYFTARRSACCGRACVISRTGYTGELGYEIMAPGADIAAIFERLIATEPVRPAGLGARDSLRLEMCYPLYGSELSVSVTPLEAGLGGFLDMGRDFLGAAALRRQAHAGPGRTLAAVQTDSRRRAAPGDEIFFASRPVGTVTSAAFSPSLEVSIAMGYVRPEAAEPDTKLVIRTARADLPATVHPKPLYRDGTARRSGTGNP